MEMLIGLNQSIFEGEVNALLVEDEEWPIPHSLPTNLRIHVFYEGVHSHD